MAEYYVVRDKNTGLYFRGKGVNRWGKYYNQASIYRIKANAENTIKEVSWRGEQAEIVPIQIVETTADVVPKSEYDAVVSAVDNSTKEFLKLHDKYQEQVAEIERLTKILNSYALQYGTVKDQQAVIDKAKAEVASEIFEETERLMQMVIADYKTCSRFQTADTVEYVREFLLAELKKKYTEGNE